MKTFHLKNSSVEIGVLEECGHLFPVRFFLGQHVIEPMHIAPWTNGQLDDSVPPVVKNLRGDFFCAPFGASDLLPEETRTHGTSANDFWNLIDQSASVVKLELSKKISGASLIKEVSINKDETTVYQKHTFIGGKGKIPVGHHAMLKIPSKAFISFSDFIFGGTPPQVVEPNPDLGRSVFKYPQQFTDLNNVQRFDSKEIEISAYPFEENHEDLFMIISQKEIPFGWSAVGCPEEGWLWYSIKNTSTLPNTVVWLSNGGRYYPPFSSRHKNVIGVEETCSFFHLGHKASIEDNFLNKQGYQTFIELHEDKSLEIPYLFGVVTIPRNFGRVKSIIEAGNGVDIIDYEEIKIHTKVNLNFIKGTL